MEAAKKADREAKAAAKAQRAAEYAKKAAAQEAAKADEEAAAKEADEAAVEAKEEAAIEEAVEANEAAEATEHLQRRALNSRSFACSAPKNISLRQHFRKRSEKEESRTLGLSSFLFRAFLCRAFAFLAILQKVYGSLVASGNLSELKTEITMRGRQL